MTKTGSFLSNHAASMTKGLHHVGISVRDLAQSIEFYCDIIGMQMLREAPFDGGVMDRITGITGTRGRVALLQMGTQHLELFAFAAPTGEPSASHRTVSDHGISHFCIEVTDIHQDYERLKAAGVEFHCEPQSFGDMKATYARDPDGNVFELLELQPKSAGKIL